MDTKRFLIATLLSVAILILWQQLFPPPEPPPRPVDPVVERGPEPERPAALPAAPATPGTAVAEPPAGSSAAPAGPPPATEPIEADSEERVTLEDDSFEAVFTNRGGSLVSLRLKNHNAASGDPVDFVRQREGYPLPLAITSRRGEADPLDGALFAVERERTRSGSAVTFRYAGPAGTATKRFALAGGGVIRLEVEVPGRTDWGLLLGPGVRNPTAAEAKNRFLLRNVIYRQGDETEDITAGKQDEDTIIPGSGLRWIGIQDTYFLNALLPEGGIDQILVQPLVLAADGLVRARSRRRGGG